jgi:hypothetical protein
VRTLRSEWIRQNLAPNIKKSMSCLTSKYYIEASKRQW